MDKFNDYEIWDRTKYTKYMLSKGHDIKESKVLEFWDKFSKGFNFVIAIYQDSKSSYMFYSVGYFNNNLVGK